jgi:putative glutamine amidotransferase
MKRVALCYRKEESTKPYADALRSVGLEPVLISPDAPLGSLDAVDGLLLSGGADLNPALYGAKAHPATSKPDNARDELEVGLISQAVAKDVPSLCICRGMQILNVALGGTLQQDIPNHRVLNPGDPGKAVHAVAIRSETLLSSIVRAASIEVNSRHHQAVDQLSPRLVVSGVAPDGIIEAVEVRGGGFLIGVQWHPENQIDQQAHRLLFERFAAAVSTLRVI